MRRKRSHLPIQSSSSDKRWTTSRVQIGLKRLTRATLSKEPPCSTSTSSCIQVPSQVRYSKILWSQWTLYAPKCLRTHAWHCQSCLQSSHQGTLTSISTLSWQPYWKDRPIRTISSLLRQKKHSLLSATTAQKREHLLVCSSSPSRAMPLKKRSVFAILFWLSVLLISSRISAIWRDWSRQWSDS